MSQGTVLVLEDSRVQAQLISKLLERLRWSTVLSFNEQVALRTLKETRVDLMLLDVYVGETNTLTSLPKFRDAAPHTPVAIMTAGGQSRSHTTLQAARTARVDFILTKPFDTPQLEAVLDVVSTGQARRYLNRRQPHVLVVDDCRVVRSLATKALMEAGYRISVADTMESAFENVDIAHVDVVLTDIFMPGMGGIEGIGIIRKTWPYVHVIAMSAGVDLKVDHTKVLSAAKHVGAVAQLPKPFKASDLTTLVEAVMDCEMAA